MNLRFGILTVSDTCYENNDLDESGQRLSSLVFQHIPNGIIAFQCIVPDECKMIQDKLLEWSESDCDVILTTGGTGLAPRDVTPEATRNIIEKELSGISSAMMMESLKITPFAMLSRAICGIKNNTLIINLPGSVKAVTEHFLIIKDILPHSVSVIKNNLIEVNKTHKLNRLNRTPSKVVIKTGIERVRESPFPLISVKNAHKIITGICIQTSDIEIVDIKDCLNRVLAYDVIARDPLPPFRASTRDGYAVKSSDGMKNRTVRKRIIAGDTCPDFLLADEECVIISTGAPVPEGADAVIEIENTVIAKTTVDGSEEESIKIIMGAIFKNANIREIGSDIKEHSVILKKGISLKPAEIGLLATVGEVKIKVFRRLSVGVISTGNEIQEPDLKLKSGCVRDSNKITLLNLLKQHGYVGKDYGIIQDEPNDVKWILEKAFSECSLVITTGGVSMGERDIIKNVLIQDFGAVIHFGRVNMKPGKPTTFATCQYNNEMKYIFGLPGNPVSTMVTSFLFVLPTLKHYENQSEIFYPIIQVQPVKELADDILLSRKTDKRPEYMRVVLKIDGNVTASGTGDQISSRLNSFVNANGLLIEPPESHGLDQNDESGNRLFWCYVIDQLRS